MVVPSADTSNGPVVERRLAAVDGVVGAARHRRARHRWIERDVDRTVDPVRRVRRHCVTGAVSSMRTSRGVRRASVLPTTSTE